jgi:glycosyltransferase involved in cell wall biosynthesis
MQPVTKPLATRISPHPIARERSGQQRPVRVCFLIDELASAGTETQLLALIRRLDRSRVQPYLCLLRGDSPMSQRLEPEDCPVLRLQVGALRHPRTLAAAVRLVSFLRRERMDVVQTYFPDSSYFGVPLAWLAGVPHRIRTRNNMGHWVTPVHRWLGWALNAFTTLTVCNCQAARQSLLTDERPRPNTVLVLPNGVDLSRFEDIPPVASTSRRPIRVGIVANLRQVKGLDVFLQAAAQVARDRADVLFEVAGEGELRPKLETQIAATGLGGRFLLRGQVQDIPAFLATLDVAVLASHAEGMPNAVLEYMAAGRPIVATAVGATSELIGNGEQGLLVPPGDPAALAGGITRLVDDAALAQRLGEAARQRAWQHYSREAMVRRFEEMYEQLRRGNEWRG